MCKRPMVPLILAIFLAVLTMPPVIYAAGDKASAKDTTKSGDSLPDVYTGEGRPIIFFPETTHDFDTAAQMTSLTYVFKVLNKGDAPLKLTKVSAS